MMYGPRFKDLTNKRFGRLVAIKTTNRSVADKTFKWLCRCDCGKEIEVYAQYLNNGDTQSCGCLKKEVDEINLRDQYEAKRVDGVAMHLFNDKPSKNNTTGYRGVFRYKTRVSKELRYGANLTVNKKVYTKKGFMTAEEAYCKGRLILEDMYLPKIK